MKRKYDVFISCKSEDYNIGRQVYEFLVNYRDLNLNVFMADKELRKQGNADYGTIIDDALDSSTALIIVSSNADYLKKETSSYVYEEWHTFVEEIRSGRKKGNIITIFTNEVCLDDVPIALRNRQSFPFTEFSPVVDYLSKTETDKSSKSKHEKVASEPLVDHVDFDLDFDDAVDFIQDGELQDAIQSLICSFKNGNGQTVLLFNKILFQNFGIIDWNEDTWDFLEQQASENHSFANLAFFYRFVHNKEMYKQAADYLKNALSDKKNGYAFLCEGIAREKGIGTCPNLRSAMKRYEHAYQMGIAEASSYLAEMYLNGNSGLEIDTNKAKEILEDGCIRNDARSYYVLAKLLVSDNLMEGAVDKVIELYQKAISLHMYESFIALGNLYEKSFNIENRLEKATHCYLEAIKHGIKDGHAYIAKLYWKQERYEEARIEAEIGEKNDNVLSISVLGEFYEEGVPNMDALIIEHKPDYPKAWFYYKKAFSIGGKINDAISLARLYVKKEYRPNDMSWDIIEGYLEEGIKVPISQAIDLMVDVLKLNGREEDATKYIKIGADNGSLSMMYEYGRRSLSSNTGEGLKYLEDSAIKGYEPSILKLLEYYQMHKIKIEYEKWLEIAYEHQIEIPISDYSYFLFKHKRETLWNFLKKLMDKNPNAALFWMSFYLWKRLTIPSDEIQWLLKEIYNNLEAVVTYNTKIYEIYADLLIRYADDNTYNKIVIRVSKINEYRGSFFSLYKEIRLNPNDDIRHFRIARTYAYNQGLPNEWCERFRRLMYMSLTTKTRLLVLGKNTAETSAFIDLLESESLDFQKMLVDSVNKDEILEYRPQAVVLLVNSSAIRNDVCKILSDVGNPPIINLYSKGNIEFSNNSTFDEWIFTEEHIIKKLRQDLILLRRNELGVPLPDFKKFIVINCEDEDSNYELVKIVLNRRVVLYRAHNGIEAVTLCEELKPDLFLMDIRMPEMSGLDAVRIIKEVVGDTVSVIALSAYAFDENIKEALMAGMDDFLAKPFRVEDLLDIVTSSLETKYILNVLSKN